MKTWMIVVLAVFVLAGFIYLGSFLSGAPAAHETSVTPADETSQTELSTTPSSSTIPTTSTSEPQAEPGTFEPITIIGSGDKTSPPFTVTTDEWIIDWSYEIDPEYEDIGVAFGFFIYPRGETAGFVESITHPPSFNGSTYSYAGAGEYYVLVVAGGIESWEIIIRPPQ